MKTSEYTIENLVQGARLLSGDNEIEVQGVIGKAIIVVVVKTNAVGSFTLESLKHRGYELIKEVKMNGEFEVKSMKSLIL